jgi:hypothetical protein
VFDLLIRPHPSFTELRIQDEWWAWARKAPDEPRRMHIETSRSSSALVLATVRRSRRRMRAWASLRGRPQVAATDSCGTCPTAR